MPERETIMSTVRTSLPLRWLIATIVFPIGGFIGHLVGGPAATIPAALVSGGIAGAIIGLGQGFALKLRSQALVAWVAATAVGLGLSLAVVTGAIGQIGSTTDAAALGAVAGLVLGIGQAFLLRSSGVSNAWIWAPATAIAWAAGWFVTASAGIALDAGWPVFGLSGAIVSQVITGIVLWRLTASHPVVAATPV
jgi:hypothetical protein